MMQSNISHVVLLGCLVIIGLPIALSAPGNALNKPQCPLFYYFDHGIEWCEHCSDICDHAQDTDTENHCKENCDGQ
jgi:hypothetical protein